MKCLKAQTGRHNESLQMKCLCRRELESRWLTQSKARTNTGHAKFHNRAWEHVAHHTVPEMPTVFLAYTVLHGTVQRSVLAWLSMWQERGLPTPLTGRWNRQGDAAGCGGPLVFPHPHERMHMCSPLRMPAPADRLFVTGDPLWTPLFFHLSDWVRESSLNGVTIHTTQKHASPTFPPNQNMKGWGQNWFRKGNTPRESDTQQSPKKKKKYSQHGQLEVTG